MRLNETFNVRQRVKPFCFNVLIYSNTLGNNHSLTEEDITYAKMLNECLLRTHPDRKLEHVKDRMS